MREDELMMIVADLGMEDLIALPQTLEAEEVRALLDGKDDIAAIQRCLLELVEKGVIEVFAGYWDEEPQIVDGKVAGELLRNRRNFDYDMERALNLKRIYYIHRANLLPEDLASPR